jgi:hypothetical protein
MTFKASGPTVVLILTLLAPTVVAGASSASKPGT